MQIDVTIGWTKPDRAKGYSNFDGYRIGAQQHTETITLDVGDTEQPVARLAEVIVEAVFTATNSPYEEPGMAGQIRAAIAATGYRGQGAHYSISVGDTVTIGETMWACERIGWKIVNEEPRWRYTGGLAMNMEGI